jgi:hypothetical protein
LKDKVYQNNSHREDELKGNAVHTASSILGHVLKKCSVTFSPSIKHNMFPALAIIYGK